MSNDVDGWQFWVDRGGTFTDIVACAPSGKIQALKLLSHNPNHYEDAVVAGIRQFLRAEPNATRRIAFIKMGTTVGTNALLERHGEPTVLAITAGLHDVLRIGTQQRPDIFALDIQLTAMLYSSVVEVHERLSASGQVVVALDCKRLRADLADVRAQGFDSLAVVLLHAYRYHDHELQVEAIAKEIGFRQISVSHQVSPLIKLVSRGDTTMIDAYLTPVLERYIAQVRDGLANELGNAPLLFMQSHGGLIEAKRFRGKDSILSGPAGGVVGMAAAAQSAGFEQVIGFDMGGTSTDVSLFDGEFERTSSAEIAGIRITAPMLHIHTVAAGGGSILKFASERLQVGPDSAGALPGPACYRNGGPLTVTDANVHLGRIQADFFPAVFGPNADQSIDHELVGEKFSNLAVELAQATGQELSSERLAAGFLRIAVERMANAIKQVSVQRGHDVTRYALSCFGGAAGQHACQVADALGITTVLIHPLAGVLSAYGMGVADLCSLRSRAVEAQLDEHCVKQLVPVYAELEHEARDELAQQRINTDELRIERRAFLRIHGSDSTLPISFVPGMTLPELHESFKAHHLQHFGFALQDQAITVESVELEAIAEMPKPRQPELARSRAAIHAAAHRQIWLDDDWQQMPIYSRESLAAGERINGPAIIAETNATTLIDNEWRAEVDTAGHLCLKRLRRRSDREQDGRNRNPITLELFNNLYMHIAEQMGVVLKNTAHSVNIKERLDFSCAVFDSNGDLIANAPHLPVHLGSMGDSVRAVLRANAGKISPHNVFMLNAPYQGGTHLPDITVVTPVFDAPGKQLQFLVANRAHHADIGGLTPGSMPATSRTIEDEGIVFDNFLLVQDGHLREREIRAALAKPPYPARNPDQNIADLKAQIAANIRGIVELENAVRRFGLDVVRAYMSFIKDNAEECVRRAIVGLEDGHWRAVMDSGEEIVVTIQVDHARREAIIDFAGTSSTSQGNFNAPAAVARAAVLYVFRTLVADNIPLNEGCLKPLTIRLPEDSLVNPSYPAAVVAGNVETSQCICDALLGALNVCAASQGTMNNLTFGNNHYQYYETLCGGAGAGDGFHGASAVHTHMTNSRLTDPEVLEWRYPVRLRRFEIRQGSGGRGRWHGGNGIIREIEFLEPMQGTILSGRRIVAPFGLAGGENASRARNYVVRSSGKTEAVGAAAELEFAKGDRFVIETPGGGGFGRASD